MTMAAVEMRVRSAVAGPWSLIMRFAIVPVVALSLLGTSSPAFAQHERMPGTAQPAASAGACAQNSRAVTQALDEVNARVEEARQLNDPARLRAAVGDLQLALTQMKVQLADCVALGADAGGAMGNMPGLDHSKMPSQPSAPQMHPGALTPAPAAKGAMPPMAGMDHSKMPGMESAKPKIAVAPKNAEKDHSKMAGMAPANPKVAATEPTKPATISNGVVVLLRTEPAPPRNGKNDFEVTVKDAAGKPITDADVSLRLVMPAMPGMESTVKLASAGNGAYKGTGTIGMSGDWDVTVTATRKGQPLVAKRMRLSAK